MRWRKRCLALGISVRKFLKIIYFLSNSRREGRGTAACVTRTSTTGYGTLYVSLVSAAQLGANSGLTIPRSHTSTRSIVFQIRGSCMLTSLGIGSETAACCHYWPLGPMHGRHSAVRMGRMRHSAVRTI
eukprot:COSAG01_NODE_8244_length_2858_cov_2.052918_4_plen_129_part_00